MTSTNNDLEQARQLTAVTLLQALHAKFADGNDDLTQMRLAEVEKLADEVARILPAGNVVTMVFSQLSSIKGRNNHVTGNDTRRLMGLLKQGISTYLDKATYLTFYTTPAILIRGYQSLLQAAGVDPEAAFPYGTWQYYLEFGLREDAGRHACETMGMRWAIRDEHLKVSESDQLAAWLMAVSWLIQNYDHLVAQEWHERMLLKQLAEYINAPRITARWVDQRPYGVPQGVNQDYLAYRQEAFTIFILKALKGKMRDHQADETLQRWHQDETLLVENRAHYQEQMSLLATLEPGDFSDERVAIPSVESRIAIFYEGQYYLVPLMHNGMAIESQTFRAFAHSILNTDHPPIDRSAVDEYLIKISRQHQREARERLPHDVQEQLEQLRAAPILINWNTVSADQPLGQIRQGRRGIGDHPLTLFRTDHGMVFDQSHIFFDAIWGMAVAEIMTNQATSYLRTLHGHTTITLSTLQPPSIDLVSHKDVPRQVRKLVRKTAEVDAEMALRIMPAFRELRQLLGQRHKTLRLTVNDLLILYRSLYHQEYVPGPQVWEALEVVSQQGNRCQRQAAKDALQALESLHEDIPALLIPIDASATSPKERIYPVTFRPQEPWTTILPQHQKTWQAIQTWQTTAGRRQRQYAWDAFTEQRTRYLEMLRMFGLLMLRYKEVALAGSSMSTMTLKILASVPKRLQSWLSSIPDRIDLLNDMLKGTEVFSNVGRVADSSSLTRFITAKDDNEKKALCWGIMTRADDVMVITLRDFRPWVTALQTERLPEVATLITEDFLAGYAEGLYRFVTELAEIVRVTGK